ncbi:MAG: DUF6020 family protein [Clostridia bacterium]|nr:DUF6020 family protein [Clostridia bacterium]
MRINKRFLHLSKLILAAPLAYGAAEALFYMADAQNTREQSLAWVAVFLLVLLGYRYAAKVNERRAVWAALTTAAVFSVCTILGREISTTFKIAGIIGSSGNMLRFMWRVLCMGSVFYIPLVLFFSYAGRARCRPPINRRTGGFLGIQLFAALWIGILICWLPYYLSFFPGSMSSDSVVQLEQALGTRPLSDAHPVMHTALIALCVWITALLGVPPACVALYSSLQMLGLSAAFAYACAALFRWGAPRWVAWGSYALFALFPMHPSQGMIMWKDIPHATVTLLLVIQWMDCAREPKAFFASWKRLVALVVTLFFFGTFRHNGFYVCLLSLPLFLWFYRAHWKRSLAVCLATLALLGIYRGPLLSALHPERGDTSEFLSIPAQHIARVVVYREAQLSEEDKEIIGEVLPYSRLIELYDPRVADPVKHKVDEEALRANPGRYASFWLQLVRRYPGLLLESLLSGSLGYWYPETEYVIITLFEMLPNSVGAERHSIGIPDIQLANWILYRCQRTPGIAMLFSIGVMMWAAALAAVLLAYKQRRDLLPPFVPLLFLWLSLLGSAVYAEYRYAYGIIVCVPICMGAALAANKGAGKKKESGIKI